MANEITDTFDLLATVKDVIVDYYQAQGIPLPMRRYVTPGRPAFDCAQLTVRGDRRFPHTGDVLREEPTGVMSLAQVGVQIDVQIARDAPAFGDDDGNPPSAAAMESEAALLYSDSDAVLNAIREAISLGLLPGCQTVAWVDWVNDGESGNIMSGTTRLVISLAY